MESWELDSGPWKIVLFESYSSEGLDPDLSGTSTLGCLPTNASSGSHERQWTARLKGPQATSVRILLLVQQGRGWEREIRDLS